MPSLYNSSMVVPVIWWLQRVVDIGRQDIYEETPQDGREQSGSAVKPKTWDLYPMGASRSYEISEWQALQLEAILNKGEGWTFMNNCTTWALDVVERVTGEHLANVARYLAARRA